MNHSLENRNEISISPEKYVLVTGASRGIGRSIALKFASEGYNLIIISSKSSEELNKTRHEIQTYSVECLAYITDVSDYDSVMKLGSMLFSQGICPDCIINNAGISYFGLIQDMSIEDWNRIINTNLSSVFHTTKAFINKMISRHSGCIINISSVWGNVGASCETAYSASKGGVNSYTKALAKELAPCNIRVNAISCGAIDTSMNSRLDMNERKMLENEIPAGRMGTCEEVADMAYHIYSIGSYMTGQIITIDGGWT